ncbi:HEPN domain-containing protein [Geoalkalibacter sp.]|uniref:HEPN domain-containing protein n=1 Tax=Geoalkalibacter sp. TaxID=3041440 RepID=UPI00272E3B7E|nr:HEPN domain-containing protein [Geoalkalibacter sp.]
MNKPFSFCARHVKTKIFCWKSSLLLVSVTKFSVSIAQQAAEKLLKALLADFGVDFPRTHNLRLLMDLLTDAGFHLPESLADLDFLTPYGTLFRYEHLPSDSNLERRLFLRMVQALREMVDERLT